MESLLNQLALGQRALVEHLERGRQQQEQQLQQNAAMTAALQLATQHNQAAAQQHSDDDSYDDDSEQGWADVLPNNAIPVTTEWGQKLVRRLKHAPPLVELRDYSESIKHRVEGVPITPPARRNTIDRSWQEVGAKLELAMHAAVPAMDGINDAATRATFEKVAMFIRSAWQDVHEARRRLLAGSTPLDRRADAGGARLLTDAEEKRVRMDRKAAASKKNKPSKDKKGKKRRGDYYNGGKQPKGKNPTGGKGKGKKRSKGKGAMDDDAE